MGGGRISAKPLHSFTNQWPDNVKIYKDPTLIKIYQACGSRVMSIFTKRPRPAEMMFGKASSPFCVPVSMLYCISMQNLNKIYHVRFKSYEHIG